MIRALGGEVSWDNTVAPGATFSEEDNTITHQVGDRPAATLAKSHLGRYYVQPQWVFDSLNRRDRIPEKDYALGETLPPHLSPFIADRRIGDYVPPEEKKLMEGNKEVEEVEEEEESEDEEDDEGEEEEEEEEESDEEESGDKENEAEEIKKMSVEAGKAEKIDLEALEKITDEEEYRLRVMMIKKKHRGLYKSMMKGRRRRTNEAKGMEKKRKEHDENQLKEKKFKKKAKLAE